MKAHPVIRKRAIALRHNMTDAERILWSRLRGRQRQGWMFRRQLPIGSYIVDFACVRARLIVEVDGHTHSTDDELKYDAERTAYLRERGWYVLRVGNIDVYKNLLGVLEQIDHVLRFAEMTKDG